MLELFRAAAARVPAFMYVFFSSCSYCCLVPFITTAAFTASGSIGQALIYPIAVPAMCFVLGLMLMPETRHISIWKEAATARA